MQEDIQDYAISYYSKLQHPILEAKYCQQNIFVVDSENILYIFDSTFNLVKKTKLSKKGEEHHFYSNAFSISNNFVSAPLENSLMWIHYDKDLKVVHKSDVHLNSIVFTSYCKSSKYLLSASEDGRVYLHDTLTKTLRYVFSNKPDHCSYISISERNRFAYVGYFNGENLLLNLQNDHIISFETKYPIELASFFDNEKKLFLADREGNSIIYDCVEYTILSQKVLFTQWASSVVLSTNKKFFIVGTRTQKLYLLDPYNNELIQALTLPDSGVTSMDIKEESLLLSCTNGTLLTIDLAAQKEEFLIHLNLKEYDKAQEILQKNYFLTLDDSFEKFGAGFDEVLIKAKEYITKKMFDEALSIVQPFMGYKKYRTKLDQLFMQQDHIASFLEALEKKDIVGAYGIAYKYPLIESLNVYLTLEKHWNNTFTKARKVLEEDPLRGEKQAQEILALYEKVSQKSNLVRRLLTNKNIFTKADNAIKKQDFGLYFKLCEEYVFLKDTSLYKKVDELGYSMQRKALEWYKEGMYAKAKEVFRSLLYFPSHKKYALSEIAKIEKIVKFTDYVAKEQKEFAYSLANKHTFLSFTDAFERLNKPFEEKMQKALSCAKVGDVIGVQKELWEYMKIKELQDKIDSCIKIAYLKQLEDCDFSLIKRDLVLRRYFSLFGSDDLIEAIFEKKGYQYEFQNLVKSAQKVEVQRYSDSLCS